MRPGILGAFLCSLPLAACVVHGDGYDDGGPTELGGNTPATSADLRFTVLLEGSPCEDVPAVVGLHVVIDGPGAILDEDQACPLTGQELVARDFPAGSYRWTITALDAGGAALYEGSGLVELAGSDRSVVADLASTASSGSLTLLWSFAGLSCEAAGVTEVRVRAGGFDDTLPCAVAGSAEGVTLDGLASGHVPYELDGLAAGGGLRFHAAGSAVVAAGEEAVVEVDLAPAVGTATLQLIWTFEGQGSCVLSGVQDVHVTFRDAAGTLHDARHPCRDELVAIGGLSPGAYEADLGALDATGQAVFELLAAPVQVEPGTSRVVVDLPPRQ